MKFEEKIKQKFLYSKNLNIFKIFYFFVQFLKYKFRYKKSYSFGSQDLIIEKFFKNKKNGIYIDVGCYHPIYGNNTYKLFKKGWRGINIDIDFHTIDLFNFFRKNDENINTGVSDKDGESNMFFFHNRSAINTLNPTRGKNAKEIKKIKIKTLNSIIEKTKFYNSKINLLSIDVEGHEMNVLKGFDIKKYSPDIIIIEYMDLENNTGDLYKIEFYQQNINKILNSELYNYMIKNEYSLVNWTFLDLVWVSNKFKNNN